MNEKFKMDGIDVVVSTIVIGSLAALVLVPGMDAGTKATVTQVLWAGLVGLGLKKVPA